MVVFVVLAGGLPVTFSLVRNTRGPRERAFVVRSTLWAWGGLAIVVAATCLLSGPYTYALLVIYLLQLPVLVYRMTVRQMLIRESECGR
jgi:hypothetical protein